MAEPTVCPECGAPTPADAPCGLCPACLMRASLAGTTGAELTVSFEPKSGEPASGVLASLAGSLGGVPRVLLRDSDPGSGPAPVEKPDSPELPPLAERTSKYQLFGEIARGGMGAVLKARDPDLGRELALKVLLERHKDKPELVRRFLEEAQIGGQLQHPGIVPVYDLGAFADRRPYFAMKLVKGRTLAALLAERPDPAADLPKFLGTFEQVCQTMAYAHARWVIHRDLKPSNIMVGSFGEVQVMDWGLAKVLPRGGVADESPSRTAEAETVVQTARSGSDADGSRAGSVMGTPAYMPPEQARGETGRLDERADVFALGSILCEVLTGRPAFVGRSAGEIQRAAALGDTANALARLDACGADAELAALAKDCLARERDDRPRDASAVVARLGGYLASIERRLRAAELERAAAAARAEEARARLAVERSRRRTQAGLAASLLLLTALGGLGGAYLLQQHHEREARFAGAFTEARTLSNQAHDQAGDPAPWRDALAAIDRVEGRGHEAEVAALRAEIQRNLAAAERLAKLRQDLVEVRANLEDSGPAGTDSAYDAAFRAAGLDLDELSPAEFARRLEGLPGRAATELSAFLDDWAAVRRLARRPVAAWRQPLEAARRADPDPYRDRLRAALLTEDLGSKAAALRALAAAPQAAGLPAATTGLLGQALANAGQAEAAVALLRPAAVRYPDDVWVNYILAEVLNGRGPSSHEEAIRYYTAARALRPATAHALAHLLARKGRGAEAEAVFRDLAERRPEDPRHFACLGNYLKDSGRAAAAATSFERAIAAGRAALRHRPDDAPARYDIGRALAGLGRLEEAASECRAALRLRPDYAEAHYILGHVLAERGKPGEAAAELRAAIRLEPDLSEAHYNLGNVLGELGKADDAAAELRTAIRQRPDYAQAHSNLGLILRQQGRRDEAVAEFRAAIGIKPDLSEAHTNLANALAEQGKPDEAVAVLRTAVRIMPDDAPAHCLLGLLLRDRGDFAGSLAELRMGHDLGMSQPGWPYPSARWVTEVERLAKLADRLPAVIRGEDRPSDGIEHLAFARMAYDAERYAAAARLWAETLDADPKLADDRRAQCRYNAACAAALAASSKGKDDPRPDDITKAKLRRQALDWLKAELAAWSKTLDSDPAELKAVVARTMAHWKADADLAGIRDEKESARLPEEERAAFKQLWAEVDQLLAMASGK